MKSFCLKMLITAPFINMNAYAAEEHPDLGVENPLYAQENPSSILATPSVAHGIDEDPSDSDLYLDQSIIDEGQRNTDALNPFALGNAIIKDRIEKNQSLIDSLRDQLVCPKDRHTRYGQMVGSGENYFKGIEEANDELLGSEISQHITAIQNDIDRYVIIKEISDGITQSTGAEEKNNAIQYLYDYLSHEYKKCEFDEKMCGPVSVDDFREKFFYKILRDILCKTDIEKYDFLAHYTTFTKSGFEFEFQLIVRDLRDQSAQTWSPLLENPLLKMKSKNKKIVKKIEEVEAERERIFTKRNAIVQRLALMEREYTSESYCKLVGPLLIKGMMDWRATDEEIKAEVRKLNQWLIDNKGTITSQMPRIASDKIYNFINPPQERIAPVTLQSKKPAKKKASVRSETDSAVPPQMPMAVGARIIPNLPAMKPVVLQPKLAPLPEQRVRTEPKQKTRGEARVDEIKTEEHEEESMSPTLHFANATEYPDWIGALIVNKHLKIRQSVSSFLSDTSFKGAYQQTGDKYVFSLLSPIDGEVYAETFHNPHANVGEKSWPSWRYALYNLLVKSHIIDGVIR